MSTTTTPETSLKRSRKCLELPIPMCLRDLGLDLDCRVSFCSSPVTSGFSPSPSTNYKGVDLRSDKTLQIPVARCGVRRPGVVRFSPGGPSCPGDRPLSGWRSPRAAPKRPREERSDAVIDMFLGLSCNLVTFVQDDQRLTSPHLSSRRTDKKRASFKALAHFDNHYTKVPHSENFFSMLKPMYLFCDRSLAPGGPLPA